LADSASGIDFGATTYLGSTNAVNNTTALRDASGEITASVFNGRATQASYADLAEIYSTDKEYEVGTVMAIGGDAETTAFLMVVHLVAMCLELYQAILVSNEQRR